MRQAVRMALIAVVIPWLHGCGDPVGDPSNGDPGAEQFTASLDAAQIVGPGVISQGTGSANFTYDGAVLSYSIDVQNMTEITMAHIHGAATRSANAPIRLWLFGPPAPTGPVFGRLVTGSVNASSPGFEGATLADVVRMMRNDSAYVLVHTVTHPDGEIRGHVTKP